MGSWQGEKLEMEKLNPLPSSSRGDNKALQGVRRSIRKEMQPEAIVCPLGGRAGVPTRPLTPRRRGTQGRVVAFHWSAPEQVGCYVSFARPRIGGLCFFCCCLNSSITHRGPRSLRAIDPGSHHHPSAVVSPLRLPKVQSSRA